MQDVSLYFIIVTYNAEKWISTFAPPLKNLPDRWKVIVIDNASADKTVSILREEYPHFDVIESKTNLGFGRANNIGLKQALADNVDFAFLLNQDACITVESLKALISVHQNHPECLVTSPLQLKLDQPEINATFAGYCHPSFTPSLLFESLNRQMGELYYSTMISAATWLMSKKCLQLVGGFNPAFFHYYEDEDYTRRILFHGYRLGLVTNVQARHFEGPGQHPFDGRFMKALLEYVDPSADRTRGFRLFRIFIQTLLRSLLKGQFKKAKKLLGHILWAYRHGFLSEQSLKKVRTTAPAFLE